MRPSSGPLSTTNATAPVPQEVLDKIQTRPVTTDQRLFQRGEPDSYDRLQPTMPLYGTQQEAIEGVDPITIPAQGDVPEMSVAPTTTSVQELTPEQQMADYQEQGSRLAEPVTAPNFNTPDEAFNTLGSAIQDIGSAYESYDVGRTKHFKHIKDPGRESSDLSYLANDLVSPMFNPDGTPDNEPLRHLFKNEALGKAITSEMGLTNPDGSTNQQAVDGFSGSVFLATTGVLSNIRSRKYKDQVVDESGDKSKAYDFDNFVQEIDSASPEQKQDKMKGILQEAAINPQEQPIINALIDDYAERLGRMSARPSSTGGVYAPKKISKQAAAAFAYKDYLMGLIDIGKDKNGVYHPVNTDKGNDLLDRGLHAAAVYDVELRHNNINEPLIKSQSYPGVANRLSGKADMYITGRGKIKPGTDIMNVATTLMNGVGYSIDLSNYSLLNQMANMVAPTVVGADGSAARQLTPARFSMSGHMIAATDPGIGDMGVNLGASQSGTFTVPFAYSPSPYAKSIANLSASKVEEKVREMIADNVKPKDIVDTVTAINTSKLQQVFKHINDYMKNNVGKVKFGAFKISDATNRLFQVATDVNAGNHGGTIRAAFAFGNKASVQVTGDVGNFTNTTRRLADKVYLNISGSGIALGEEINNRLHALQQSELAMLDASYQMAKYAAEFGIISVQGNRPTPHDYLKAFDANALMTMAAIGQKFKQWVDGKLPANDAEVDIPGWERIGPLSSLFEKKEWGPKVSNAIMAANIVAASRKGGGPVVLDATIETDASQSNAAIISMLIGDIKVANILGFYLGSDQSYKADRENYKDLRNLVASSIDEDIDATMTGEDEAERKEAIRKYLEQARERHGVAFDKMYARGIVVAGLYGKHPEYMFLEVENMLASIGMSDELDVLENTYNNKRQEMLEDFASIYSASMKKHLANLQGWQRVVAGIASLKAVADGSTTVKAWGNSEIELGISYATHMFDEANMVKQIMGLPDELSSISGRAYDLGATGAANKSLADLRAIKERLAKSNQDITDLDDQLIAASHAGEKVRKALPVILIQAGDAFMMASSYVYANRGNKSELPLNIYGIHDAQMTAPGSTLLMHNAYNNVSPYMLADNAQTLLDSLYTSVDADFNNALKKIDAAGFANIGSLGRYKSMGGYFNRMYNSLYFIPRDVERGRTTETTEMDKFKRKYQEKILDIAIELGWVSPTNINIEKYTNNKVSPAEYRKLYALVRTAESFENPAEDPAFPELHQMINKFNAAQRAEKKRTFNSNTYKHRLLQNFKTDNKQINALLKSNKNYIVNSK